MSTTADAVNTKKADADEKARNEGLTQSEEKTREVNQAAQNLTNALNPHEASQTNHDVEQAKQPALQSITTAFTKASEAVGRYVGSSVQMDVNRRRNAADHIQASDAEHTSKHHKLATDALKELGDVLRGVGF